MKVSYVKSTVKSNLYATHCKCHYRFSEGDSTLLKANPGPIAETLTAQKANRARGSRSVNSPPPPPGKPMICRHRQKKVFSCKLIDIGRHLSNAFFLQWSER